MAFCPNCGAPVEGRFCAKCGTAAGSAGAAGGSPAAGPQYAGPSAAGLADNIAAALCYPVLFITGILFLVLAPYNQNKFVRFHAFQAIFVHVAFIAVWVAESILAMMLPWSLSVIISLLSLVITLGCLAILILLVVKAYQGERFKLPVIGDLAEKQA